MTADKHYRVTVGEAPPPPPAGSCEITTDWYGEPHGPHADGHNCMDQAEFYDDSDGALGHGYTCRICGFLIQVG